MKDRVAVLRKAIGEANALVDDVPEELRSAVYPRLLELLMADSSCQTPDAGPARRKEDPSPASEPEGEPARLPWEERVLRDLPEAHVVAERSRSQQAAWAVVRLWSESKAATTEAVQHKVKDELGLSPEDKGNLSRTLGDLVPRFATREKEGRGYAYRPTRNVLDVFNEG